MYRRDFLKTSSALAMALAMPKSALAWTHGSAAFTFNGGKSQAGLNSVGFGDYTFLNLFKSSQGWSQITGGGTPDIAGFAFDSDGYPTAIVNGGVQSLFEIPNTLERAWTSGCLTISWKGTGTIAISGLTLVTGNLTSATSAGSSVTVTPTTTRPSVGISAIGSSSDYPHDIKVYFTSDQSLIDAGQMFSTEFLARLRNGGFGALRFLGWGSNTGNGFNDCAITTWASRKPTTYFSWVTNEYRLSWYAGVSTNVGDAYSITPRVGYAFGSGFPADKQTFIIQWSATASGNSATLSWNGNTPKAILRPNGAAQFTGGHTGRPGSGQYHTVVYDAALDAFLDFGTDTTSEFIENGVPPEIMVALCKTVGAHIDFPVPFLACDPLTDFLPNLLSLFQTASGMIPRIEGPNETWNNGGPFYATQYSQVRQSLRNGAVTTNGTITNASYSVTAVSYVANTSMTLTIGAHSFAVGSNVALTGPFNGLSAVPNSGIVTSFTTTTITINAGPSSGTWTSGGTAQGNATDVHNWYGRIISKIGQQAASSYGVVQAQVKTQTKYQVCCGVQTGTGTATGTSGIGTNSSDARLTAAAYVVESGNSNNAASVWTTHVRVTNYISPNTYGTSAETTLSTAFGGVLFTASISGTAMTVASIQTSGGALAIGMTLFGANIPGSITITGGSAPNWTISSSLSLASQSIYASVGTTQPASYIDGLNAPASFTGSVSGSVLTASGITNQILVGMVLIYSGSDLKTTISTDNGNGTYNLSRNLGTIGFQAMTADTWSSVATLPTVWGYWKTWAQANSVNKMNCYEGSYSPDYTGGGSSAVDVLRYASKQVASSSGSATGLQGYTTTSYNSFVGLTGGGFTAEFPSLFVVSGRYPSTNVWADLEDIYQNPDPPQWKAVIAFNAH